LSESDGQRRFALNLMARNDAGQRFSRRSPHELRREFASPSVEKGDTIAAAQTQNGDVMGCPIRQSNLGADRKVYRGKETRR
jgi:hypothetical protein